MSDNMNKILLKPRFKLELDTEKQVVIDKFTDNLNSENCDYSSKISGNHIFIDVPENEYHFWSPQLHLEIEGHKNGSLIRGLFAPKPTVWTFFMFLHFIVAVCFLVFFVIAYSKWSIGVNYSFAFGMCLVMVLLWFILYFSGQLGKLKAINQMDELRIFIKDTLKEIDSSK